MRKKKVTENYKMLEFLPLDVMADFLSMDVTMDDCMNGTIKCSTYKELIEIQRFINDGDKKHLYNALRFFCAETYCNPVQMMLDAGCKSNSEKLMTPSEIYSPTGDSLSDAVKHYLMWLHGDTDMRHDRAFVCILLMGIELINADERGSLTEKEENNE